MTLAPALPDLEAVLAEVWSSYVGAPELLEPLADPAEPAAGEQPWTATVTITGGWQGIVTLDLAESVVLGVTRGMLGFSDDETPDAASCADAIGELVNIVGGNVKSMMPGPSTLSLPVVSHGSVEVPSGLVEATVLHLRWSGAPMRVRVLAESS